MGNTLAIVISVLLGALGLGVLWLLAKDRLYTMRTGKPAEERAREWVEHRYRPLTRGRYVRLSVFCVVISLVFLFVSVWSPDYKGASKIIPLAWLGIAVFSFFQLQVKWRKQKRSGLPGADAP